MFSAPSSQSEQPGRHRFPQMLRTLPGQILQFHGCVLRFLGSCLGVTRLPSCGYRFLHPPRWPHSGTACKPMMLRCILGLLPPTSIGQLIYNIHLGATSRCSKSSSFRWRLCTRYCNSTVLRAAWRMTVRNIHAPCPADSLWV